MSAGGSLVAATLGRIFWIRRPWGRQLGAKIAGVDRSDSSHIRYLAKVACVVLPGHALLFCASTLLGVVSLPVQLAAWVLGSRGFLKTWPYRALIQWHQRYDAWAREFIKPLPW